MDLATKWNYLDSGEPAWCSLDHICPSNIAWIKFDDGLQHLVPREWLQDRCAEQNPEPRRMTYVGFQQAGELVRSDGMIWNKYRLLAICGADASQIEEPDTKTNVRMTRDKACPECWNLRW